MRALERDIERRLVDGVKKLGGRAYKWVSPGSNGVPDRIVILPGGKIIFIELKTTTGRLTDLQKIRTRAGLAPLSAAELTLENIYLERMHELALEGWQREDMIRFGKYLGSWWNKPVTTENDLLLPIPSPVLSANPNLTQNPR